MFFEHLSRISANNNRPGTIPCVALAHNEMIILPDFLQHYRAFGDVSFFVVDDRSDDGSREYLLQQPDVTLFEPKDGSTYAEHKRHWRSELLDAFASGVWCLVPDIDEHLVYRDHERKPLRDLIDELDSEASEAVHCTMLDMYADLPLVEHAYTGGGLAAEFPLTDGPDAYMMLPAPRRYRRRYPTPRLFMYGGMRDRLFYRPQTHPSKLQAFAIDRVAGISDTFDPGLFQSTWLAVARRLVRPLMSHEPFVCSKLTLVKWRVGMSFSGGSHSVSEPLILSRKSAALLHFKFVRGARAITYVAERGQHAGGSALYKKMLEDEEKLKQSPVYIGTTRYAGSSSLDWILK